LDLKNRIDTYALGSSIPDGLLFDFRDKENPEFYLVEIELAKHDFYRHIFPQITKFFAFFKNSENRNNLIDKIFHFIQQNSEIEKRFKDYSGEKEIYKTIKDIIENSQNILIIMDREKEEIYELMKTYTDTWDKMVTVEILKQYTCENEIIFTLDPDFEEIEFIKPILQNDSENTYSENFHIEGIDQKIVNLYEQIKESVLMFNPNIKINPQKYYISLRENKNFAYLETRKRKIRIVIMLSPEEAEKIIKKHKINKLSEGVQNFYNGPCFYINLENKNDLEEIIEILKLAREKQK
jgi:predicted transport protein